MMRPNGMLLMVAATVACSGPDLESARAADLVAAHEVFLENLAAIRATDSERYLSHYLNSPDLVAVSPAGLALGYAPMAESRRSTSDWPDSLEASAPTLVWLGPGVVYGAYEYEVFQEGQVSTGWSERVFIKTRDGWKIAVTSVIPAATNQM